MQGLGYVYGTHLLCHRCGVVVLMSRSGSLPLKELLQLARLGRTAIALQADSSCRVATGHVLMWARECLPYISHFAHAAGLSTFTTLQDMYAADFGNIFDIKVGYGWHKLYIHVVAVPALANATVCASGELKLHDTL
jgi:hypothetical protein